MTTMGNPYLYNIQYWCERSVMYMYSHESGLNDIKNDLQVYVQSQSVLGRVM